RPFTGWSEVNEKLREKYLPDIRKENGKHLLVAADSYVLGANLDFLLHDQLDIYVLDNARNIEHGRAYQYRIWDTDEQALRKHIGKNVLVIIEETALNSFENWKLQRHFCTLFDTVDYLEEVDSMDGRKRFVFLSGNKIIDENTLTSSSPLQAGKCELGVFSCLDTPKKGSVISGMVKMEGWAFKDEAGVSIVEIMINDQAAGVAHYGISRPDVKKVFSGSRDPNHPNVGFMFYWDSSEIEPGKYSLAIRVNTVDGGQRVQNKREITVAPSKKN
ncbi:MAG: hypothetical protein MUP22_00660, partial [Desulfobacterales bacterium]|nr:hypothetical protein [Desulfobacterales bacterium]